MRKGVILDITITLTSVFYTNIYFIVSSLCIILPLLTFKTPTSFTFKNFYFVSLIYFLFFFLFGHCIVDIIAL